MTMLDDHHPVIVAAPTVVAMFPEVAMFAEVAMLAEFGTRAETIMVVMLDHQGLSTRNRRRRNGDRAQRCENVSKLLHIVLLH
jgi:hypothetical protein